MFFINQFLINGFKSLLNMFSFFSIFLFLKNNKIVCLQLNRGAMALIIPPSGLFNSHQTLMAYSTVFKVINFFLNHFLNFLSWKIILPFSIVSININSNDTIIFIRKFLFENSKIISMAIIWNIIITTTTPVIHIKSRTWSSF